MSITKFIRDNSHLEPSEILKLAEKKGYKRENIFKTASRLRTSGEKIPLFTEKNYRAVPNEAQSEIIVKRNAKTIKLSELKSKYSLPSVIKTYLQTLGSGEVIEEREMMEDIDIKKWSNYRTVLNSPELEAYRGRVRNVVYWGMPKTISEGKEDGTLRNIKY